MNDDWNDHCARISAAAFKLDDVIGKSNAISARVTQGIMSMINVAVVESYQRNTVRAAGHSLEPHASGSSIVVAVWVIHEAVATARTTGKVAASSMSVRSRPRLDVLLAFSTASYRSSMHRHALRLCNSVRESFILCR